MRDSIRVAQARAKHGSCRMPCEHAYVALRSMPCGRGDHPPCGRCAPHGVWVSSGCKSCPACKGWHAPRSKSCACREERLWSIKMTTCISAWRRAGLAASARSAAQSSRGPVCIDSPASRDGAPRWSCTPSATFTRFWGWTSRRTRKRSRARTGNWPGNGTRCVRWRGVGENGCVI